MSTVTQQIAIGAATRARTNAEEIDALRGEVAGLKERVAELEALLPIGKPPEWLTAPGARDEGLPQGNPRLP